MGLFNPNFFTQKVVALLYSVSIYLLPLFRFISTHIFRVQKYGKFSLKKKNEEESSFLEAEHECVVEKDFTEFIGFDKVVEEEEEEEEEEEKEEVYLRFKFPSFEEFVVGNQKGTGEVFNDSEVVPSSVASTGESFNSAFIDELDAFPVKQNSGVDEFKEFLEQIYNKTGCVDGEGKQNVGFEFDGEEYDGVIGFTEKSEEQKRFLQDEEELKGDEEGLFDESEFSSRMNSPVSDSDTASTSFGNIRSVMDNGVVDSNGDRFLPDIGGELDVDGEDDKTETESELSGFEENRELSDVDSDIMEELKQLEEEEHTLNNSPDDLNLGFLSEKDFFEDLSSKKDSIFDDDDDDKETMNGGENSKKAKSKDTSLSDSGDGNKLESLWEHQELMEQLKMELRKVRATGLPTIMEDSESPKIMDDLKPWKIDEKFQRGDCIGELHKFYKSYRERMRKFDILNYQKMYAMGFLQLKDPLRSASKPKLEPPTLKSIVSQNFWLFKHKVHGSDPMKKFIKELEGDLEVVYVGHMCLSWEFLHWQHEKALDLWDSDPRGIRKYNEVAGEFQQFQVLLQRYVEDEPYQGPRVQNYVKCRCSLRNLLQVPVIREDNLKDKRKARKRDAEEYVITSDMLVEIVEESIRIFWRFVRADKDCTTTANKGHKKSPELQNPEDLKLLVDIRKDLQKKERKLKDLLRSENCILRKFRQCREDETDQVLYFFAQVDMKLVSRVLNMSKITNDQLSWCHNKLDRIRFVNRKIHVEPAFLLFPC